MNKYSVAIHFSGMQVFDVDAEDFKDAEYKAIHLFMISNISHNDIDIEDIKSIKNQNTQM